MPLWNVPTPHGVHDEAPALEMKPAGQLSHVGGSLSALRKVPALQSVQYEDPRSEEPVVHSVHLVAEPPLLMAPAGQYVQVPLGLTMLPGGHGLQPSEPLASLLPATGSHGLHSVCPASSWYSPSAHVVPASFGQSGVSISFPPEMRGLLNSRTSRCTRRRCIGL